MLLGEEEANDANSNSDSDKSTVMHTVLLKPFCQHCEISVRYKDKMISGRPGTVA